MVRPIRIATRTAVLAAAVLAIAVPAGAPASPHSGHTFTQCGDSQNGGGWFDLEARNTACRVAAKVADHFIIKAHGVDDGFKSWHCHNIRHADDPLRNACTRTKNGKRQKIKFEFAG